ncbi:MAG: tRNA (guanosine(46)-N7)-methyltransferase TrmB [Hyphomicrobiaceae bacterium]|nr:tRNA (guanosine(46)-N7)-methyltransferase TrmB [Hyphomicrobiaceae bacterium]
MTIGNLERQAAAKSFAAAAIRDVALTSDGKDRAPAATFDGAGEALRDLRSFGRRRGRKATDRQRMLLETVLPRVAVDPEAVASACAPSAAGVRELAAALGFEVAPRELWLEIGFGGGEHLVAQALACSDIGLIGAEPFEDGVVKVLDAIETEAIANIRVLADDVRPLLRALPAASLSRVFVLFPDPWPKRRHQKRRLIQPDFVELLARVLKPGGEFRFASDIDDYVRTALIAITGNPHFSWVVGRPSDWRTRPEDWPQTRYEQKAYREGRKGYFFRFRRI